MRVNKYDKPGQPSKYKPEELKNLFNEYIEDCIENGKLANVTGFSVYAGMNRDTYYEYSKREDFSDTIKGIESLLEDVSIQEAFKAKNAAFLIFYLKNKFNWKDKTEVETTNVNKTVKQKTTEELLAELAALENNA